MNYGRESWRKLYRHEPPEQCLWPILARGLRDLLIRHADDDGTLFESTNEPVRDLLFLLRVRDTEADMSGTAVRTLISDGYLQHDPDTKKLSIKNFVEAQEARSPEAERKARKRAEDKAKDKRKKSGHVRGQKPDTSADKSRDEKRREEI